MDAKRVLCAGLVLGLAWSGCGDEGPNVEEPLGVDTAAGNGGSAGSRAGASGGGDDDDSGDDGNGDASAGDDASGGEGAESGAGAGSNDGEAGAGTTSNPNIDGVESSGCGRAPEFQGGTYELELGGSTRTFIVDVPEGYDPDRPYPIVFGFHGRDFSGEEFRSPSYGNLLSVAGDEAILVHPDTTSTGAWELESDLDVEFFDAMLETLSQGLCVDASRVFATGHSSGGYFTNVLGCRRGDVLRAIAPVAGGVPSDPDESAASCEGPISVWIAHGEEDETVPFINGESTLAYWLSGDDCDADSAEDVEPEPCVAFEGCSDAVEVRWCAYAGGHDWPGFAARGIWDFFKTF